MYGGLYKFIEGREPLNLRNTKPDSQQTKPALNYKVKINRLRKFNIQNTIINSLLTWKKT